MSFVSHFIAIDAVFCFSLSLSVCVFMHIGFGITQIKEDPHEPYVIL